MSDRQGSCEERIQDELRNTEAWLAENYRLIDKANEVGDNAREEELREEVEPCGIGATVTMKLELSGGGPADWLEVELGHTQYGFQAAAVTYHFADWFDHAEREVTEHEAPGMWRMAEYYAELAEGLLESSRWK